MRSRRDCLTHAVIVVCAVALALVFAGCQSQQPRGDFVIGSILPLTGDGASYGKEIKNGIDLAVEQENREGGVDNRKIVVRYEDSAGDPKQAVSAMQKLMSQSRPEAVIGDAFSSPALAIAPIANRDKIVMISPTASSPKLSGAGPYFFRNWPSDEAEATAMAEFAVKRRDLRRFAILYSTSAYGVGLKDVFAQKIPELGATVVAQEAFREGDVDFRAQLTKIKGQRPDAVYITGYWKEFANILKQARELGLSSQFLSCGTFHEPKLLQIAGNAAEGVVFVQPMYDPASAAPAVSEFVSAFKSRFGIEPGLYAAHGYDATRILIEAARSAEGRSVTLRDAVAQTKGFVGVTGNTSFNGKGDVVKGSRIMAVSGGRFVDVKD